MINISGYINKLTPQKKRRKTHTHTHTSVADLKWEERRKEGGVCVWANMCFLRYTWSSKMGPRMACTKQMCSKHIYGQFGLIAWLPSLPPCGPHTPVPMTHQLLALGEVAGSSSFLPFLPSSLPPYLASRQDAATLGVSGKSE
jgi:hypothetical protein